MTDATPTPPDLAAPFAEIMATLLARPTLDPLLSDFTALLRWREDPAWAALPAFVRRHGRAIDDSGAAGLLQAAYADGATSPFARAAETWVATHAVPFAWLRLIERPIEPLTSACVLSRRAHEGGCGDWLCSLATTAGPLFFTAGLHGEVGLWHSLQGSRRGLVQGFLPASDSVSGDSLTSLASGRHVLVRSSWGTILRLDVEQQRVTHKFENSVVAAAMHPDGERLVVGKRQWPGNTIEILDATTLCEFASFEVPEHRALRVLPDGARLVLDTEEGLRVWDLTTGKAHAQDAHVATLGPVFDGGRFAVSADGETLLACLRQSLVRVRLDRPDALPEIPIPYSRKAPIPLDDGGNQLALIVGARVVLWDLAARRALRTLAEHGSDICAAALLADGRHLVTIAAHGDLAMWDLGVVPSERPHAGRVLDADATRGRIAVGDAGAVRIWTPTHGDEGRWTAAHDLGGTRLRARFEAHGALVAWDTETHKDVHAWDPSADAWRVVASHAGGAPWVAAAIDDGTTVTAEDSTLRGWRDGRLLWEASSGAHDAFRLEPVPRHARFLLQCYPDDHFITLWDATSGTCLHRFPLDEGCEHGHQLHVLAHGLRAVLVTPNTMRLLDLETGQATVLARPLALTHATRIPRSETIVANGHEALELIDAARGCLIARVRPSGHHPDAWVRFVPSLGLCLLRSGGCITLQEIPSGRCIAHWSDTSEFTAIELVAGPPARVALSDPDGHLTLLELTMPSDAPRSP